MATISTGSHAKAQFAICLRAGLAVTPQRAYDRGVNRDLNALPDHPDRKVVGDDLDSAPVRSQQIEVEIVQGNLSLGN